MPHVVVAGPSVTGGETTMTSNSIARAVPWSPATERGSKTYTRPLLVDPRTIGRVRRAVAARLRAWGFGSFADEVALCLTELLANVIKHTEVPRCVLTLETVGTGVRLTVSDASHQVPVVREPDWIAECGRGMHIIVSLASSYGWHVTSAGKDVWVEFRAVEASA